MYSTDFAEALAKAKAVEGCTHFMFADGQDGLSSRCCEGDATSTDNQYSNNYVVYEILDGAAPANDLPSYDTNCANAPQPDVEADPAASPPPAPVVTDPTEPVVPVPVVPPFVDPNCTPKNSVGSCG